ncbi:MAG: TnpV protein [Lachnospiraceae bacterium]|nr:TnpV protein [Lachnospiraceae bacterium]
MEITYHEGADGMMYPDIKAEEMEMLPLGKYGIMAMEYMEENHNRRYRSLLRTGRLMEKMKETEEEAGKLLEQITESYLETHRPADPHSSMEIWKIREQGMRMAEEIVLDEVIHRYH